MDFFFNLIPFMKEHYYLAYIVLFLGSYFETLIGPGFFIYGEIFFLSGSILAGAGDLNIWIVAFACISGGILGDTSSYIIGREYGHRIIKYFFKKGNKYLTPQNYNRAARFIHKNGLKGIFFARLMGPISWITPFLAGTIKVKYSKFLKYNVLGVIAGIGMFLIAGYFFGFSYNFFLEKIQKSLFYVILFFLLFGGLALFYRYNIFDKILNLFTKEKTNLPSANIK